MSKQTNPLPLRVASLRYARLRFPVGTRAMITALSRKTGGPVGTRIHVYGGLISRHSIVCLAPSPLTVWMQFFPYSLWMESLACFLSMGCGAFFRSIVCSVSYQSIPHFLFWVRILPCQWDAPTRRIRFAMVRIKTNDMPSLLSICDLLLFWISSAKRCEWIHVTESKNLYRTLTFRSGNTDKLNSFSKIERFPTTLVLKLDTSIVDHLQHRIKKWISRVN